MNIFSGNATGGVFENNQFEINCNNNSNLFHNPTPSLSDTLPVIQRSSQQSDSPDNISFYKYVTSVGDVRVPEVSPQNAEYSQEQLEMVSSYFYDKYKPHWRTHLTHKQNVIAMQHFEQQIVKMGAEPETDTLTSFCINNCEKVFAEMEVLNANNHDANIKNQTMNQLNTELIKQLYYNDIIMKYPEKLEKSFEYALSIYPNNHNKTQFHSPPVSINSSNGLRGGMPIRKGQSKRIEHSDSDDDDEEPTGITIV